MSAHSYSRVHGGEYWCDTHDSAFPCPVGNEAEAAAMEALVSAIREYGHSEIVPDRQRANAYDLILRPPNTSRTFTLSVRLLHAEEL